MSDQTYLLQLEHLTKRFLEVVANDDISLTIGHNQIISLIGENGAGKSTLCKMLTGMYQPTSGKILLDGEEVRFSSTRQSMEKGISMVYQERNLVDMLTGAQNICLNLEPTRRGFLNEEEISRRAEEIKAQLGVSVPLDVPVGTLGAGEKQLIEIMRAIYSKPKLLILDEPTASLGEGEIEPFLAFVRSIKRTMNLSVIFISHKIQEVFDISDEIAVLTDGRLMLQRPVGEITQEECINAMLRSGNMRPVVVNTRPPTAGEPLLRVEKLRYDHRDHSLNFEARRGEVVGFYGLVGAGRTECMEALFGIRRIEAGEYTFDGERFGRTVPYRMIEHGMILTPETRNNAIFRTFSLVDNICNLFLRTTLASKRIGFTRPKRSKEFTRRVLVKNNVKYSSIGQPILELSGGNIQKIVIGRSIEIENVKLLIVDEPTTGMDIGAKNEIYLHLRELAERENICVLFVSSELEELMMTCDRMYVFAGGDVIGGFERTQFDKARILEVAIRGKQL